MMQKPKLPRSRRQVESDFQRSQVFHRSNAHLFCDTLFSENTEENEGPEIRAQGADCRNCRLTDRPCSLTLFWYISQVQRLGYTGCTLQTCLWFYLQGVQENPDPHSFCQKQNFADLRHFYFQVSIMSFSRSYLRLGFFATWSTCTAVYWLQYLSISRELLTYYPENHNTQRLQCPVARELGCSSVDCRLSFFPNMLRVGNLEY